LKILLVYPSRHLPPTDRKKAFALFPPMSLAAIAALTPPDVELRFVDESFEEVDIDERVDLVAISAMTAVAPRSYYLAREFRKRGVPVAMGGIHPTVLPQEAARYVDAVVVGEAEGTWPQLLEDLRHGRLQDLYSHRGTFPELDGVPLPRRAIFDKYPYFFRSALQSARGCPFDCHFCSVTRFFGRTYRMRPVDQVVEEARQLRSNKLLFFADDNIVGNPARAKELFRALRPLKIVWAGQSSITLAKDEELMRLAAESGCAALFIGFESLSSDNLLGVGKKINVTQEFEASIRKIQSYGINVEGAFIFGFDNDDPSVFERTVEFGVRNKLVGANYAVLTPLPGTKLFAEMAAAGRIFDHDWTNYDAESVVFYPKRMTPEQLAEGYVWANREFHSYASIYRRLGLFSKYSLTKWGFNLARRNSFRRVPLRRPAGMIVPEVVSEMEGVVFS